MCVCVCVCVCVFVCLHVSIHICIAEQVGDAQSLRDYADFLQTTNKDLANARTLYTRALQLQPSCVRTHCSFGRLLHDAGQLDGAERHYRVSAPLLRLATHALHMPYTCPHSNLHSETTSAPKDMQDRYASKGKLARAALHHWCVWPRTITKLHNKKHVHSNSEADNTRSASHTRKNPSNAHGNISDQKLETGGPSESRNECEGGDKGVIRGDQGVITACAVTRG